MKRTVKRRTMKVIVAGLILLLVGGVSSWQMYSDRQLRVSRATFIRGLRHSLAMYDALHLVARDGKRSDLIETLEQLGTLGPTISIPYDFATMNAGEKRVWIQSHNPYYIAALPSTPTAEVFGAAKRLFNVAKSPFLLEHPDRVKSESLAVLYYDGRVEFHDRATVQAMIQTQ